MSSVMTSVARNIPGDGSAPGAPHRRSFSKNIEDDKTDFYIVNFLQTYQLRPQAS